MFRWAAAQSLPESLVQRLGQAGGLRSPWHRREPGFVLVYLAPHQLLRQGQLPLEGILTSYELTLSAAESEQGLPIHGERLLQCQQRDLAQWVPGQPLPCQGALQPAAPLEAAVLAAIMRKVPELAATYQQLEQLSERGNSPPDQDYGSCLDATCQPESLILAWNQQQSQLAEDYQQAKRGRGLDLQRERCLITAEQEQLKLRLHDLKTSHQLALQLLQRSARLMSRLLRDQLR